LANTLSQAVQNHKPAVTLQLTPENLGSLRIHISTGADNQISARLVVSHPEALSKLDATLQELRQNLEAKGVHVDQLRVTLAGEASTTIASQHLGGGGSHPRQENRPDGTGLSNAAAHNPFGGNAANGGNTGNAFGQNAYETFQGMAQDLQQQSTWRQFNGQEPSQASGSAGHSPAAKGLATDNELASATSPTSTRIMNPDGTISLLI
jgi:hypothetical protein